MCWIKLGAVFPNPVWDFCGYERLVLRRARRLRARRYYYDAQSGFYYDATTGLFYDGNNQQWYTYDQDSHQYNIYNPPEGEDAGAAAYAHCLTRSRCPGFQARCLSIRVLPVLGNPASAKGAEATYPKQLVFGRRREHAQGSHSVVEVHPSSQVHRPTPEIELVSLECDAN